MNSFLQDKANTATNQPNILNLERFNQQTDIVLAQNHYLKRQQELESNARSYPRRIPIAIQRAHGIYVEDTSNNIFIDCLAGAGTLALGHNHPAIHHALKQHLDSGAPLHTLDLTTPAKDAFIENIFDALPLELAKKSRIQFCSPSGADAVEAAIKLTKIATGRRSVLAFTGGYHGMTHGTLSLMGNLATKTPITNLMSEVQFLPYPNTFRCPFGLAGEASIDSNLHYIENLLGDPESGVTAPAAIILEAVQGEGGVIPAPIRWLQGLRKLTQRFDIPLIMDEVQSGIGRTGAMFAFEHAGIVPDVVVISKAIGGGLPLAVVIYDKTLDKWAPGAHTGTFRGNQMAMVAGAVTLDVIRSEGLCHHAEQMGQRLMRHLQTLQQDFPQMGDVRGRGLMVGVEMVKPGTQTDRLPAAYDGDLAAKIQQHCIKRGLILELGGRDGCTIRFLPPLIIQANEIDRVAEVFSQATAAAIEALDQ